MKRFVPINSRRRLACLFALLVPFQALAQNTHAPLYSAVEDFLRIQTQGLPGKVSYRITPLDNRTQIAACDAFEPFLPANAPPWGKLSVGIRCLGPSSWTIYMQAQISVQTNYVVAARPLMIGQTISASDIVSRSGDLGALPSGVLMEADQAIGKTVKMGISSGQPLRSDQLVAPWVVKQGQTVKTISQGSGFSVSSEGRALNNAAEGQIVQVRTPSGQTVSGIARMGGVVEINH